MRRSRALDAEACRQILTHPSLSRKLRAQARSFPSLRPERAPSEGRHVVSLQAVGGEDEVAKGVAQGAVRQNIDQVEARRVVGGEQEGRRGCEPANQCL